MKVNVTKHFRQWLDMKLHVKTFVYERIVYGWVLFISTEDEIFVITYENLMRRLIKSVK